MSIQKINLTPQQHKVVSSSSDMTIITGERCTGKTTAAIYRSVLHSLINPVSRVLFLKDHRCQLLGYGGIKDSVIEVLNTYGINYKFSHLNQSIILPNGSTIYFDTYNNPVTRGYDVIVCDEPFSTSSSLLQFLNSKSMIVIMTKEKVSEFMRNLALLNLNSYSVITLG